MRFKKGKTKLILLTGLYVVKSCPSFPWENKQPGRDIKDLIFSVSHCWFPPHSFEFFINFLFIQQRTSWHWLSHCSKIQPVPAEIASLVSQDDVGLRLSCFTSRSSWIQIKLDISSADFVMVVARRHKAQSVSSTGTASRSGGSLNDAAVERYLREKDAYQKFLVNGPRDDTSTCQPPKQQTQSFEQRQRNADNKGAQT